MTRQANVPQAWGKEAMVPLDKIKIPSFQRGEKNHHVKSLAEEFWMAAFVRPVFWLNDGWFYCLDGQQRCAAAAIRGIKAVPGVVLDDLSHKEAARVYTFINRDRKNLTPLEKFVGAMEAGGDGENEIAEILREFGMSLNKQPMTAIQSVYNDGNLRTVYSLIHETWGCDFPNAVERPILMGLNTWLKRRASNGGYDREKFVRKMRKHDPIRITQVARRERGSTGNGLGAAVADETERLLRKRG